MAVHAASLRGAHFTTPEYQPSEKGRFVMAGIGIFLAVSTALIVREMVTYDEVQTEPYEINEFDTYDPANPTVSPAQEVKSLSINLNLAEMRRARAVGDIPRCEAAVARIAIASPGFAETLEC